MNEFKTGPDFASTSIGNSGSAFSPWSSQGTYFTLMLNKLQLLCPWRQLNFRGEQVNHRKEKKKYKIKEKAGSFFIGFLSCAMFVSRQGELEHFHGVECLK